MVLQSYKAVYYFSSDLCCNYGEGTFEIKSNRSKKKSHRPPWWLFFAMRVIENEQFFKVGLICDLRLNTFTKVGIINDTNYKDLL